MSLLQRICGRQSDERFNQMISDLQYMNSSQNERYGQRMFIENGLFGEEVESYCLEFFYFEDDE